MERQINISNSDLLPQLQTCASDWLLGHPHTEGLDPGQRDQRWHHISLYPSHFGLKIPCLEMFSGPTVGSPSLSTVWLLLSPARLCIFHLAPATTHLLTPASPLPTAGSSSSVLWFYKNNLSHEWYSEMRNTSLTGVKHHAEKHCNRSATCCDKWYTSFHLFSITPFHSITCFLIPVLWDFTSRP